MSLYSDMIRISDKAKAAIETIVRETEIELFSGTINGTTGGTPVDTGQARAGWFYSTGNPSDETADDTDKDGGVTVGEMVVRARAAEFPRVAFLSNSVPYIIDLEEGSSTQAPHGMVRTNLKRAPAVVRQKVRENKL